MNNIVKSVVFAAIVLFAGIAAMQVIYKGEAESVAKLDHQSPEEVMDRLDAAKERPKAVVDAYDTCLAKAMENGNVTEVEKCNKAWEATKQ